MDTFNNSKSFNLSLKYARTNSWKFEQALFDFLKIPSISSNPKYRPAIIQAAEFVKDELTNIGLDRVVIHNQNQKGSYPGSCPIVTAEKIIDLKRPTLLIYGHYDVQPPDPMEGWQNDPFQPIVKKNRVYARGASDDKGQLFLHIKAVESILKNSSSKELPVNIKFLIEGEEEISSPSMFPFLSKKNKDLSCDFIVISDTEMFAFNHPAITYGLRGISYFEIQLTGPKRDVHSGMYGGVIDNPANVLSSMLGSIKDQKRIAINGFYDDVLALSREEIRRLNKFPFDEKKYQKELGVKNFLNYNNSSFSFFEQKSAIPTFDICGLDSGYQGEGSKTIIPSIAKAKISFRLVPNQKSKKINHLITEHLKKITPETMEIKIIEHGSGDPFIIDPKNFGIKAACKALNQVYQKETCLIRSGGSIPIVSEFKKKLKAEIILMGFGLTEDNIHSPNESFSLTDFHRGVESSIRFIYNLSNYLGK